MNVSFGETTNEKTSPFNFLEFLKELFFGKYTEKQTNTLPKMDKENNSGNVKLNLIINLNKTSVNTPQNLPKHQEIFLNAQPIKIGRFFKEFYNHTGYTVLVNDTDNYHFLRAINLLKNKNFNIQLKEMEGDHTTEDNRTILLDYSCKNYLPRENLLCTSKNESIIGEVLFFNENSANILLIQAISGEDLVKTTYVLTNDYLFDLNETDSANITSEMYLIAKIPERISQIQEELTLMYRQAERYEYLTSDQELLGFANGQHLGNYFRAVAEDIAAGWTPLDKDEQKAINNYDFSDLIRKGDKVADQRELLRKDINSLKNQIGKASITRKFNKEDINLQTLDEYEQKLLFARKLHKIMEREYTELADMLPEMERKYRDIGWIIG